MALGDAHAPGATPLEPEELADLIPDHISTQGELNEWEQSNIVQGQARYWVENGTFGPIELAVRFHHRLVEIHPFSNGNGRHARLVADLLLMQHFKLERLPWGGQGIGDAGDVRDSYLRTLREADRGNFAGLIEFASEGVKKRD